MKTLLKIYDAAAKRYKKFAKQAKSESLKSYYEGKEDAFNDVVETIKIFLGSEGEND